MRAKAQPLDILATVDQNYLPHVITMLRSLFANNPEERFRIFLIHAGIDPEALQGVDAYCRRHGSLFAPVRFDDAELAEAPAPAYYSRAMYYRLLAAHVLPQDVRRVLYLDPDLLVINRVRPLFEVDLEDALFAAATHKGLTNLITYVNRIRLGTAGAHGYFNSGVLMMNLERQRREIVTQDIFDYVRDHADGLILPDQDVLNGLYGHRILALDDSFYNYDPRRYETYYLASGGEKDMGWVMTNTVIIHFCGKTKPWARKSRCPFVTLYKHYMQQARCRPAEAVA